MKNNTAKSPKLPTDRLTCRKWKDIISMDIWLYRNLLVCAVYRLAQGNRDTVNNNRGFCI